jgi:hypothetical protein
LIKDIQDGEFGKYEWVDGYEDTKSRQTKRKKRK